MRLTVLLYSDDPDGGGTAGCTHRLALGLAARGFRVVHVQSEGNPNRRAERAAAGIENVVLPYDTIRYYYLSIRDRAGPAADRPPRRPARAGRHHPAARRVADGAAGGR